MIATRLMGGLGNQMFQYAAGRALALRHGTELVLDLSFLRHPPPDLATPREYELDCFPVRASLTDQVRSREPGKEGLLQRFLGTAVPFTILREQGHGFNREFLEAPDGIHLIGFWQSEKYFKDYEAEIRKDFTFKHSPRGRNAELLAEIKQKASVSLHVRRGDYIEDPQTHQFHGTVPLEYYREGLERIAKQAGAIEVFVFSDDPDWCKKHIRIEFPTVFVEHNRGKGCEDMRLMSACRHHVIANSSFSWWGAWLNPRPDKIVVVPRKWFSDPSIDTSDVIPEGWVQL